MPDLETVVQRMIDAGEPEANIATLIKAVKADQPFSRRGGMTDRAEMVTPEVWRSTNEFDAEGHPVVRHEPSATDLAIMGEIGPPPGVSQEHPNGLIYEAMKQWVAAGPHAVVEGVKDVGAGNYAKGANQVVRGGAITAAPFYAPALARALVAAPLATVTSVVGGTGAAMVSAPVAEAVGEVAGLAPDQTELLKTAAEFGTGYLGSKVTPAQAYDVYEAVRHPWMTVGRGVGTATEAGVATYQARQAARAARAAAADTTAADVRAAATVGDAVAPAATAAAQTPQLPPPQPGAVTPAVAPTRAKTPAPASVAPATETPRPPAPSLRASGRWGPGESLDALRQAAAQAGYPISDGELKVAWPSVQAAGADGGPAVAALHVERMQARAAAAPPLVTETPAVESAPPVAAPVAAPIPPVAVSSAPVVDAARPAPVRVAPTVATGQPIMSAQMALNEVGLAARRAGVPMTLDESKVAAAFVQQGATPKAAIAQWQAGAAPATPLIEPPPPAPAPTGGSRASIMSPAMAGSEVALAARRLQIPLTPKDVDAAAQYVLREGLTPKAALQRWMETAVAESAGVAAPAAAAQTGDALAADLAARLGTPSPAESVAAIDARWQRGELKTPSAPTAARMKAEAAARTAASAATVDAPTVSAPEMTAPTAKPTRPRALKLVDVTPTTDAAPETPAAAAQAVTQQIERVIDTQGLKSGAAVQARVMKTLTEEIQGAREAAGFGDLTTRRTGSTGGVISVDGEPVATWERNGGVRWLGGGTGVHGRALGPAADVVPGVPADTPIGTHPINARNLTPGEVEQRAKAAVAATISRTRGAGQMTVRIPGDGNFTIERNPHAINELMKRLQSAGVSIWKDLL